MRQLVVDDVVDAALGIAGQEDEIAAAAFDET
jgi:hypothetical protein